MDFSIRIANLSDYEVLKPLHKEVHDIHAKQRPDVYNSPVSTLDQVYYQSLVESENCRVFILETGNQIIGYTFLRMSETPNRIILNKRKIVFMEDLCISQKFRGQGFGKKLFEKAADFAKEVDATSLELGVWEFNDSAIAFYKSIGMKTQTRKMELKI